MRLITANIAKKTKELVACVCQEGTNPSIVGKTPLARQSHGEHTEFWIHNGVAFEGARPSLGRSGPYFESFKYPHGKEIEKVKLPSGSYSAWGITLSLARPHK